jgi:thiol-disulfide isomerase/thioredoxin
MKRKLAILISAILLVPAISNGQTPYKAGDIAADFQLKNVRGEMVSLLKINDAKGFIVTFWCNTCPVVKKYEARLINLHKEFSDKGFPVIAINSNDMQVSPGDSYAEMQKKAMNMAYKFEYLYDESQDVARTFGATNTPHVYLLVKKDGMLVVQYVGAIDNNSDDASAADKHYLRDAVNSLLKGEQIAVKGTRAVGCSLKWKKADGIMSLIQPGQKIDYYRFTGAKSGC